MADVVHLDEQRRRRVRRQRRLQEINHRLHLIESSLGAVAPEALAAELVTIGRGLVRALQEFEEMEPPRQKGAQDEVAGAGGGPGVREPVSSAYPGEVQEPAPVYGEGLRVLPGGRSGELAQVREMSYPEFWQMISVALEEIARRLEHFSAHAARRSGAEGRTPGGISTCMKEDGAAPSCPGGKEEGQTPASRPLTDGGPAGPGA